MRIDLDVPYREKDEAKNLGARWDVASRVWYVPDGIDPKPFARWRPGNGEFNLRAAEAYLVRSPTRCWRCAEPYAAVGFLMAPGFEIRADQEGERGEEVEVWSRQEEWAFAHYITLLPASILGILKHEAPTYFRAFSKTTQTTYWANHCLTCKILQGDFNLFEEPDGAFLPMSVDHVQRIKAIRLPMRFEARGESSFGIDDADLMPGVRRHRLEERRATYTERPSERVHVKPSAEQVAPFLSKRQSSLVDRLKSLVSGKR